MILFPHGTTIPIGPLPQELFRNIDGTTLGYVGGKLLLCGGELGGCHLILIKILLHKESPYLVLSQVVWYFNTLRVLFISGGFLREDVHIATRSKF